MELNIDGPSFSTELNIDFNPFSKSFHQSINDSKSKHIKHIKDALHHKYKMNNFYSFNISHPCAHTYLSIKIFASTPFIHISMVVVWQMSSFWSFHINILNYLTSCFMSNIGSSINELKMLKWFKGRCLGFYSWKLT